jgi:hypothetical protein
MHVFGENMQRPLVYANERLYRLAVAKSFTEVPDAIEGSGGGTAGTGAGAGTSSKRPGRMLGLGRLLGRKREPLVPNEVTEGLKVSRARYNGWEKPGRLVALATPGKTLDTGALLGEGEFITTKHPKIGDIVGADLRPGGALEPMFHACVQYFSVELWSKLGFCTNDEDITTAREYVRANIGGAVA